MQIHNRMSCAHRSKQNMHIHQYTHITTSGNGCMVYACFSKNTAEKHQKRERMRKKHSILASGYLSFISSISAAGTSTTTPITIARTHIINPNQWHFTGESSYFYAAALVFSHLTPHPTNGSTHFHRLSQPSCAAECRYMQNLFSHPMGNPFQKQK